MRDLMIDIETLGNRPGSIILSIGAVTFDAETGESGEEFYSAIDSETGAAAGLTSDVSTMIWWLKQSRDASDAAFSGTRPISEALKDLAALVTLHNPSRVWAKPPSFDLVMIEAAFRACDILIPWHFATHRDCRTIFDLTATKPEVAGTAHNALDDAKAQALAVIEAYRKLREPHNSGVDFPRLPVSTPVTKVLGYPFPGTVVAAFHTLSGQERFVVEATGEEYRGMLHIFNGDQLREVGHGHQGC